MLQGLGITNVGSSTRLCMRCIRRWTDGRRGASKGRTSSLYSRGYTTSTASEPGARNEPLVQSSSSFNDSKLEKGSDARASTRTRATNVWGRMQESPKRQCILTRKTLPVDYLLKLKPRYYPSPSPSLAALNPSEAKGDGGTYLTPSLVNLSEPGRSYYLTAHREVISRIHEPGPHLGILSHNNILIPKKLEEWIQIQLEERLIKELKDLLGKLRAGTPKFKNMLPTTTLTSESNVKREGDRERGGERGVIERYEMNTDGPCDDIDRLLVHLPGQAIDETSLSTAAKSNEPVSTSTVDLRSFALPKHAALFEHISRLFAIDRKYLLRQALVNKWDMSQPHFRHLIHPPRQQAGTGTGLEGSTISISSASTRGQLALPAMVALLRLKLYSGQGWSSK